MSVKCNFGSLFELEEYKFKKRRHHGPRRTSRAHSTLEKGKRSDGYVASGAVRYGTVDEDLVLENEIIRETKKISVEKNGMSPDNGKTRLNPTYAHTQGVSGAAGSRVLFFSILSVALLH